MCKHLETRVVSCNGKTCVRSNFFCFSFVDLKYWYQLFFHSFLCRQNMVEAMHEQHPDFFKHRKNFRYVVLEKEPKIGRDIPSGPNYAFGVHSSTSDYLCGFEKQPHYHVLFECDSNNRKGSLPLFNFLSIVGGLFEFVMQGEIMKRLQVAKQYNVKENKTLLAQGRRKVTLVQIRRDKGVQTVFFTGCHC